MEQDSKPEQLQDYAQSPRSDLVAQPSRGGWESRVYPDLFHCHLCSLQNQVGEKPRGSAEALPSTYNARSSCSSGVESLFSDLVATKWRMLGVRRRYDSEGGVVKKAFRVQISIELLKIKIEKGVVILTNSPNWSLREESIHSANSWFMFSVHTLSTAKLWLLLEPWVEPPESLILLITTWCSQFTEISLLTRLLSSLFIAMY